ncbi:MAG: type II toxin-antitoxin system VapB family antitoxin [Polyangiaceae bacterium]|nr:type II toxin-antitoxin system VapB family antitoxin [Polyangiaceae bacterium]
MRILVRTTLVIDDRLLRKAKEQAASRGVTLSELVTQALRSLLAERPPSRRQFVMPTYGGSQGPVHHEPADFATDFERDDREALGR